LAAPVAWGQGGTDARVKPINVAPPPTAVSPNPAGILRGLVLDGADKTPLVGATVQVLEAQTGTYTDLDGRFEVLQLKPGQYTVVIS